MSFTLATFNVNSIKARLENVSAWLGRRQPDLVLMQELKCQEEGFPHLALAEQGYKALIVGQKSWNGVGMLWREGGQLPAAPRIRLRALPGDAADEQARYVEVEIGDWIVGNLYLPNGNPAPGPKFDYKLAWMDRFAAHAADLLASARPVVLAGDYNVIPEPEDCYDPRAWEGDALFRSETRRRFHHLLHQGWTDALRALEPAAHVYTFWDYQAGRWQRDQGIRIDHALLSPQAADRLAAVEVDRQPRGQPQPSDHTPLVVTLLP